MSSLWYARYQALAADLRPRAERLQASIVAEARLTAAQAGLDPTICFLHAHNASVSAYYGKPWPEVDYRLVRRVLWLEQKSFEPGRIIDRILQRAFDRAANAECGRS